MFMKKNSIFQTNHFIHHFLFFSVSLCCVLSRTFFYIYIPILAEGWGWEGHEWEWEIFILWEKLNYVNRGTPYFHFIHIILHSWKIFVGIFLSSYPIFTSILRYFLQFFFISTWIHFALFNNEKNYIHLTTLRIMNASDSILIISEWAKWRSHLTHYLNLMWFLMINWSHSGILWSTYN